MADNSEKIDQESGAEMCDSDNNGADNNQKRQNDNAPTNEDGIITLNLHSDSTDLITLNGCGYKTQWQMPSNQSECPVARCPQRSFVNRSALITHYKKEHSKFSIYCCICDKPIISRNKEHFGIHYKSLHPNVLDPFDFKTNKKLPKLSKQKMVTHSHHSRIYTKRSLV